MVWHHFPLPDGLADDEPAGDVIFIVASGGRATPYLLIVHSLGLQR